LAVWRRQNLFWRKFYFILISKIYFDYLPHDTSIGIQFKQGVKSLKIGAQKGAQFFNIEQIIYFTGFSWN
jgi:hypothetical protein